MTPGNEFGNPLLKDRGQRPGALPGGAPEEEVEDILEEEEESYILCRQCSQAITRAAERISKQGAHRHTFANPHGIVYEIGCFRSAIGCGYTGPGTDEFTWFPGYEWRVAICRSCLTHLGWVFSASGSDRFYGLILDRLKEP